MKKDIIFMFVGALAGSFAEYKLQYNLYDFLKDAVLSVLRFVHLVK
jgi:hypothetical protein